MKRLLLSALLAALWTSAATADEMAEFNKTLRGTWAVTTLALIDGKDKALGVVTWTFDGEAVIVREDGKETVRWEYCLKPCKELPVIEFTATRDGETRLLLRGVLDPVGDKLTVVMRSASATQRDLPPFLVPAVAESIGRERSIVMTFTREK